MSPIIRTFCHYKCTMQTMLPPPTSEGPRQRRDFCLVPLQYYPSSMYCVDTQRYLVGLGMDRWDDGMMG